MWLFVEPLDVWLFRDGRPFSAGEHVRATGTFPPMPTTMQGALRSAALSRLLADRGLSFARLRGSGEDTADLRAWWGDGEGYGSFRMRGPLRAVAGDRDDSIAATVPADIMMAASGGGSPRYVVLTPRRIEAREATLRGGLTGTAGAATPWPEKLELLSAAEPDLKPAAGVMRDADLREYLIGKLDDRPAVLDGFPMTEDVRLGIERDLGRGAAQTGRLYMAHFTCLAAGAGLAVEVTMADGADPGSRGLLSNGPIALGGEARAAILRPLRGSDPLGGLLEGNAREAMLAKINKDRRFKLLVLTNAVFSGGWCPDFVDRGTLEGRLRGIPVRLMAAAVGRPVPVAGWNYAAGSGGRPRPLRLAVPAGAVYCFDVLDQAPDSWADRLLRDVHGRSVAVDAQGAPGFGEAIGMGLAVVGVVGRA